MVFSEYDGVVDAFYDYPQQINSSKLHRVQDYSDRELCAYIWC